MALINACLGLHEARYPGMDRDWAEAAAYHPGFLPSPQHQPSGLLRLDYAIPREAAHLLALAEAEFERRQQAYVGVRDPFVWPRVAAEMRRDMRMDALAIVAAPAASKAPTLPTGGDPIFSAIQAHADARAAFSETVNPQDRAWVQQNGGDTSDEAMAPAHAAYDAAGKAEKQAWAALFGVRPTTLSGVLAMIRHAQQYAPINDGLIDGPALEEVFGAIADSLSGVMATAAVPNRLATDILDGWASWGATLSDAWTKPNFDRETERRNSLLDAAHALPATPEAIIPKALACAWMEWVAVDRPGQPRDAYGFADQITFDLHAAVMARAAKQAGR
ncbi:hypothetical protein MKK69_22020 [Methylobacterium sp. J-026]|uniref:hypothetical protein n=1 Tax=Methylobacterium sp. J-026 TaxID=2836624 RepID=UPI001FBACF92|nr:hypothetical protein [Methylobacterium sp. J-026]MCJ2136692.1 hypothetical protein [Methylobacterium sp. J-026]